jgi:hypothetical protein
MGFFDALDRLLFVDIPEIQRGISGACDEEIRGDEADTVDRL